MTYTEAIKAYKTKRLSALDEIAFNVINDIYRSRGTCGDCMFYDKPNCYAYDQLNKQTPFDKEGYCSGFERKKK